MNKKTIENTITNAGGHMMKYGPDKADHSKASAGQGKMAIAESFGAYEAEYAAIKRHVGVMHLPQRSVVRLTGKDRKSFLHSLLTQDIDALPEGGTRRSFLITEKGRLLADLVVLHGHEDTWLETDVFDAQALCKALEKKLFSEELTIENWTDRYTALSLHGPASLALLQAAAEKQDSQKISEALQQEGRHAVIKIADRPVTVYRQDQCAVIGLKLLVPSQAADDIYTLLLERAGFDATVTVDNVDTQQRRQGLRGRPVGWLAYNTARIEAGTPLFHIDFAGNSLPAETGVLDQTISFTKGCYPGQEIVARMKNLGHPARVLVGLKFEEGKMPVAGAQVFEHTQSQSDNSSAVAARNQTLSSKVVGGITSSCLSPLLGNVPIAFALVKWGYHEQGTLVNVMCEEQIRSGIVRPLKHI